MDEYKKLNNQPLQFVLAEFQFSPVMQIAEYIPKIQEALRKQYPIPSKRSEQLIQAQPGGIALSQVDRWTFSSANKREAIDLNQERLVYITMDYARFEGFSNACQNALETLASIVEPSLILRVGLRYSDLVVVDENENLSDLVNDHFGHAICLNDIGIPQHQTTEAVLKTAVGGLIIRTLYGRHNLTCLPDAQALPIPIKHDATPSERIILDFDHIWEAKEESTSFEPSEILKKLELLHASSREAFWKITTEHARKTKWA